MEPTILTAIVGGIVALVGSVVAYMTARNSSKKDITITDRQQLSQEQQDLRKEMREEVMYWRERYDNLDAKLDNLVKTNVKLEADVEAWKEKYERMAQENAVLTRRVSELEGQLRARRSSDQQ